MKQRLETTPQVSRLVEGGKRRSKRRRNEGRCNTEVKRQKRARLTNPEAKEPRDEGTVGMRDSTLVMGKELSCLGVSGADDHPPVGRWITKETEIEECRPWIGRVPVDGTFILEGKESASLPAVTKDDHHKADNALAPTHLWSFFFKESFLSHFLFFCRQPGPWKQGGENVYRRHPLNQRLVMPPGWEGAMHGFRRTGLRWWQRNLLRTLKAWRTNHASGPQAGSEVSPHNLVTRSVSDGRYAWR